MEHIQLFFPQGRSKGTNVMQEERHAFSTWTAPYSISTEFIKIWGQT